ncbi:hypothetical protein P7K49_034194 [Saguinus oedipus]|uniref:Uncharacterized protein n=1 Tax=Saguinus oedipus TaxID=9490 RepID=A0ABQ9TU24_SAGOE|nr:hypothetical protein P7K49_034194 [Saguinus oedipus]
MGPLSRKFYCKGMSCGKVTLSACSQIGKFIWAGQLLFPPGPLLQSLATAWAAGAWGLHVQLIDCL